MNSVHAVQWYVLDHRGARPRIVNAVLSTMPFADLEQRWANAAHLELKQEDQVPQDVLEAYEYWSQRP